MKTYQVETYLDGLWWMIKVPAIGGLTQARRRSEVEESAKELIAVTLDVPTKDIAVKITAVGDE